MRRAALHARHQRAAGPRGARGAWRLMLGALRKVRFPVEIALLIALCFFLPLREFPKGVASLAFIITWLVNRLRSRDFGGRIDAWDVLIACWIATGYLAAAFAGLEGQQWIGARDLHHYGLILWLVKRAR